MLSRMSIQSKLLLMLLLTSILSAAVVGAIGYQSGRSSLRASVFDRLTEIRESQSRQLETQFSDLKNSLAIYSRGNTAAEAIAAFTAGFAELDAATINIGQAASLRRYYDRMFADMTLDDGGNRVDVRALLPKSNPQRYLQALYSAPFENWERAIEFDDARDGSRWSAANARFNEFFREIVHRFEFEDLLLLDTDGNVVHWRTRTRPGYQHPHRALPRRPTHRGLREGAGVQLDRLRRCHRLRLVSARGRTDRVVPVPVGSQDQIAGVMAVQFPISRINDLMTAKGQWRDTGMGKTGETILVGPDDLMRSDSRLFRENREAFVSDVVDGGTPPEIAEESIDRRGTTLVQPVNTESVEEAQRGNTGALIEDDYLGHQALQSYSPVDLPGLHWVIVAKIDTDEAFAPVSQFTRTLVLSTVLIIFAVCLAAMLLARLSCARYDGCRPAPSRSAPATTRSTSRYGRATNSVI